MSLVPSEAGARLRWAAWSGLWGSVCYLGNVEAWIFSDLGDRPVLLDVIRPLEFWFPYALFTLPITPVSSALAAAAAPPWAAAATIVLWVVAVSRLIVLVEERFHSELRGWITGAACVGTVVVLVAMWSGARFSPTQIDPRAMGLFSGLLLCGLVLATWLYVLIGLTRIAVRPLRGQHP